MAKLEPGMTITDSLALAIDFAARRCDDVPFVYYGQGSRGQWYVGTAEQLGRFGVTSPVLPEVFPGRCVHCQHQCEWETGGLDGDGGYAHCTNPECGFHD